MGDSSSHDARHAASFQRSSEHFDSQTASAPSKAIAFRHEAQQAWGYEIEGLTSQEVAARWNAHALPCLLPTEILEDVFELWKEIEPISRTWVEEMHKWKVHHGWSSATAVCQHFRVVALGHAALWATLNRDTPWELFLDRSRNSLLCVDTKGVKEPEYLPLVLANLGRIRELYLYETSAHGAAEIYRREAPQMRFLYVSSHSSPDYTLDVDFFLNRSPSLRTLALGSNFEMPWGISSPLPLRFLSLKNSHKLSKYSFRDLLSCLRNLPLLEEFETYRSLPEGGDVGSPIISLPHLNYLSLHEYNASPLFLWSSLTLSTFHCVELALEGMKLGDMTHSHLVTAIRRHLSQPWCPSYTTFTLGHWFDSDGFSVTVQSQPSRTSNPAEDFDGTYQKLSFMAEIDGGNFEHPVISLFPSEPVRDFVLRRYIYMDSSVMAQMFRAFNALETIKATGNATVGKLLLSFIASHVIPEEQTSVQRAYLPALRALSFDEVNFDSEVPGHTTIPGISVEVLPLRDLLKLALQMRASGGSRIQTLTMQSCFTESESWIQPCSEYVRTVDWKNACTLEDAESWEASQEFDFKSF